MSEGHFVPAGPTRLALRRLKRNHMAMAAAIVLVGLYLAAALAGFVSPYSPTDQEFRDHFFHPPTPLHFRSPRGSLHWRPSVVRTHLADPAGIHYVPGNPAVLHYRRPSANLNPYLSEPLEDASDVATLRDGTGRTLATVTTLQETSEDSGVFAATLPLDPFELEDTDVIRVETIYGDRAEFRTTTSAAPSDPDARAQTLYLTNGAGESTLLYSRQVESFPVQFFVRGWRYRILWLFESDLHLFGVTEPGHIFLLGTDQSGRDQFSRILYGAQISLTVGLLGVLLTTVFGLLIGGIAGYYGGAIDGAIMRFAEILLSIPGLYLILTLRNTIPDRLQESYDRIHTLAAETFAWQNEPATFAGVILVIILLLSYYCHRKKWRRSSLLVAAAMLAVAVAGHRITGFALSCVENVLPGTTHLTSEWTYLMIILILSIVGWAGMARVIRGMVLSLREEEYVLAARALGAGDVRVICRHILPSTFGYVIVRATLLIPAYILAEVALSFLALGVQEPTPSWGNMLTQAQHLRVLTQFTWTLAPGAFIFLTVLAYNILGDGLRDAFDPKQK